MSNVQNDWFNAVLKQKTLYFKSHWTESMKESSQNMLEVSSIYVIMCINIIDHVSRDTCKSFRRDAAGDVSNTHF
jgi:hypothetical protein